GRHLGQRVIGHDHVGRPEPGRLPHGQRARLPPGPRCGFPRLAGPGRADAGDRDVGRAAEAVKQPLAHLADQDDHRGRLAPHRPDPSPGPPGCGVHLRPAWRGRGHATRVPPVDPGELADLIAPHVTDGGPGHAAGVYRDGVLVAHAAAGCAVIEHDVPIGAGTVFDIASASKQVTAACRLLLQRDGLLSLDEDVRTYLPELLLPVPVTLRQCLSHTSGLREYYSLCELAGVPGAGMDEARLMRPLGGQPSLNFPPGTGWSYSNSGFVLAAAALRRVSGRSLAEFAADRVFGPLGMRATRFRDDLTLPVPGLATGYTPAPGGGWHRADITEETVG